MSYRKRWLRKSSLVPVSVLIPWSSVHRFIDVDDNRSSSRELRFRIACSEDGIELLAKFQNLFFPCGIKAMDDFALMPHRRGRREFVRPLAFEIPEGDAGVLREVFDHCLAGLQGRPLAEVLALFQEFRMFLAIKRECRQADAGIRDRFRLRRVEAECVPEPFEDGPVDLEARSSGGRAVRADRAFLARQAAERPVAVVLVLQGAMGAIKRVGMPAAGTVFLWVVGHIFLAFCPVAASHLATMTSADLGSSSMRYAVRPSSSAAMSAEPPPAKQSRTMSPGLLEALIALATSFTGFIVGCSGLRVGFFSRQMSTQSFLRQTRPLTVSPSISTWYSPTRMMVLPS